MHGMEHFLKKRGPQRKGIGRQTDRQTKRQTERRLGNKERIRKIRIGSCDTKTQISSESKMKMSGLFVSTKKERVAILGKGCHENSTEPVATSGQSYLAIYALKLRL